jgi:hypothetical protein
MATQQAFPTRRIDDFGNKIPHARKDGPKGCGHTGQPSGRKRKPPSIRFTVMCRRGADARWFLTKCGDRLRRPLVYFDNVEQARTWRADIGQERAEQLWHEIRQRDFITDATCRGLTNMPRVGTDYRGGSDISESQFMVELRPFGCQFGNWQDNRDVCLNESYDAIRDLAEFIGWPLERMFFGGQLGLAFGARGHGSALAHYELACRCINLTRKGGAGSLAHEWAHAFDHYLCGYGQKLTAVPQLKALVDSLPAGILHRCMAADLTRSSIYFAKPCERFARCFESWVRQSVCNDYLANITPVELFKAAERYPYPLPEEMPAVAAAFQELFKSL